MKTIITVKHLNPETPTEKALRIRKTFNVSYIRIHGDLEFIGYDITSLGGENKFIEVIKHRDEVVQVRELRDNPHWKDSIKFGGF